MSRRILVRPIRTSLLWLAAAAFALTTLAELAYQGLFAIPKQIDTEHRRVAERLLSDAQGPMETAFGQGRSDAAGFAFLAVARDPDLRGAALIAPGGRIAATNRPDWRVQDANALLSASVPARGVGANPREGLTRCRDATCAAVTLGPGPVQPATDAGPWLAYFELDRSRLRAEAWNARLTPLASLLWLAVALMASALLALLGDWWLGRPLRALDRRSEDILEGRSSTATTLEGRGELRTLWDRVGTLGDRLAVAQERQRDSELSSRQALEVSGEGLWDWDMASDRVVLSTGWGAILGCAPEALMETRAELTQRIHPEDRLACESALERHRTGATPAYVCEHRLRAHDGRWRWVLERGQVVSRDAFGEPRRMIGTATDITERKRVESSLAYLVTLETVLGEASRSLLAAKPEAVEGVVERVLGAIARRMDVERAALFMLDSHGEHLEATHTWNQPQAAEPENAGARVPVDGLVRWMETLRHGEAIRIPDIDSLPDAWSEDRAVLRGLGIRAVAAVPLRSSERLAGYVSVEMLAQPRDWRDSELRALHLLADLIAAAQEHRRRERELLETRQKIEEIALYDTLTGLPNRRLLAERMNEATAAALESGTQLAVCFIDLDGFKPINDHYGHAIGDRILVTAAGRLRDQVRETDTVARLGGDEFVLLMGGYDSAIEVANAMDRIIALLGQPYRIQGEQIRVTASAGVTLYPRDSHDADTLLRHADHAMYQAKQRGRNRCRFFDTVRDRRATARRSQLERIGRAIARDELCLYYQPKVDMRRGKVTGAEALVRWQHPKQGLLQPGAFIPLLDGSDLLQKLDWWVLQAGLEQLDRWHADGLPIALSINISARSVQHEGFLDALAELIDAHPNVAADSLCLEILESETLRDLDAVASVMERCNDLGVHFALDDFGTGYSSLTYFRRLPARVLKIDQTFVRDMLRSSDDRSIVEGVVGLAHAFQREVIAEGVESAAHGLMLLHMGCEHAQGYGIAEPMPPERLPGWCERWVSPTLWGIDQKIDWSGHLLDLLTMESVHRDWVGRVLRCTGPAGAARCPELDERQCGFGRWYYGDGKTLYSGLTEYRALEWLHERVHGAGRDLLDVHNRGEPTSIPSQALVEARDRFVAGLHRLQQQVLSRMG